MFGRAESCVALLLPFLWGCSGPLPALPVTSAAELCGDASLGAERFCMPSAKLERLMREAPITLLDVQESPQGISAPLKLRISVPDGDGELVFQVKWKQVPTDGDKLNNSPRREMAAYEVQKLFLDDADYVVPPTIIRCLPMTKYGAQLPDARAFDGTQCTLGVMAYWMQNVTNEDVFDDDRWERGGPYPRHVGNLNLLTYLIHHKDSRGANFLISTDAFTPRTFSIDNGIAFSGAVTNPIALFGRNWAKLFLDGYPKKSIERAAGLSSEQLDAMAVVAQFAFRDGALVPQKTTAPLDPTEGVNRSKDVLQFGLDRDELKSLAERIATLREEFEEGEIKGF
jgi:hypothetical protein